MKTAERILATSLALFNEQGESAISSVDIANECDISPGNLYYHFKGKEQLVDGLMKLHRAQMDELLDSKKIEALGVDDMFYYFFLLIQKLHLFRFIYRSPADLMEKYPHYAAAQSRLMQQLESTLQKLFVACQQKGDLDLADTSPEKITQVVSLIITQSCQYDHMMQYTTRKRSQSIEAEELQYHCVSMLVTTLLPRCKMSAGALAELQSAIEYHQLPSGV